MPDTQIVVRPPAAIEPWREPGWQRLWLALQRRPWRSLALVPAAQGARPNFALSVGVTLSRTGMLHLGVPIQVADGARVPLASLASFAEEIRRMTEAGDRIILALAPPSENPVTTALAHSADAGLLCILMEQMASSEAKRTVEQIGADKFLGSAIFRADGTIGA